LQQRVQSTALFSKHQNIKRNLARAALPHEENGANKLCDIICISDLQFFCEQQRDSDSRAKHDQKLLQAREQTDIPRWYLLRQVCTLAACASGVCTR
jgi:hypothetical protein